MQRNTSKKRRRRARVAIHTWRRQERQERQRPDLWQTVARKRRGPCKYFGVTDHRHALDGFEPAGRTPLVKWLNRRSQRRRCSWERLCRDDARSPLPRPGPLGPRHPVWGQAP